MTDDTTLQILAATIPLSRGQVAIVDADDVARLSVCTWHAQLHHGSYRAIGWIKGKPASMHRFLMGFPDSDIDHANRDQLDNRKSNLRLCTGSQNNANKPVSIRSTSGLKGIRNKGKRYPHHPWTANITFEGRIYSLGHFGTPEEASTSYGLHALAAFGEFARIL